MGETFSIDAKPSGLFDIAGFRTGVASCGLKGGSPDIGVLVCDNPDGVGAAVLTKNAVRAAAVRVSSPRATTGLVRAVVANVGNANCYTGEDGLRDAREMVEFAASGLDVPQERVLVASNGILGHALPMDQVRKGIEEACRDAKEAGRGDFAAAIAAPDVPCKVASVSGQIEGKPFRIAGVARTAGLASSEAATTFAFLATDLAVSAECLNEILISTSERTFDRLIVDGGKGTNDTLCILSSARAGNEIIDNIFAAGEFGEALEALARRLVAGAALGGDPTTSPMEVRISGAESERDAEVACRAVGQSIAVRTAIGNRDPNWGLILTAAGRSAAGVEDSRATVRLAGETVYEKGRPVDPLPEGLKEKLGGAGVTIELDLGRGSASATIWAPSLPGGNEEELQLAKRAAREAAAAAEEAEKQRAEVEAERASLDGKLEEEASARKVATRETQVLRKRLDSTEEAKTSLEAGRKEVEAKLKKAVSAREATSKESKELTERLEAVQKAAEEAKAATAAERKALEEKLSATEKARAALEATRKELEGKLKEAESARGAASTESKELAERLEAAKAAAEMAEVASAAERKALEEKLKKKESAQAAAAKEAEELRGELKKTGKEARATIVAKRGEFEAKLKELESTREAASGESKNLAERLEAAERAAKEARSAAEAERKELTAKLKEAGSARAAAAKEAEDLRGQLEKTGREVKSAAEAAQKELAAKLKEADSARAAAAKEAENLRKELEKTGREAKSAGAALREELEAKLKEADSARAAAAGEAEGLRSRLEKTGDEAKAAAEAELKGLQAKLKEAASAAEEAAKRARTDVEGEREGLEANLKKAESAHGALLKETEDLKSGLKLAEEAAKEAKAAAKSAEKEAKEATKRADKEAKTAAKRAEKEAKAAAKAATKEAKAERKVLEAKLKAVAGGTKEIDALTAEITKRDEMIAALQPLARDAEMHLAEARRYWEEGKKVSERLVAVAAEAKEARSQLSLKNQLIEQLKGDEEKHDGRVKDFEKRIEELQSKLEAAGGGDKNGE